jgi:hypothetical protein
LRLGLVFVVSLVFLHPSVRGDGVGYYAWLRAPLIQHNFDFRADWRRGFPDVSWGRADGVGNSGLLQWTTTGHLANHYAVGTAILMAPFVIVAHGAVLAANAMGAHVAADGFSRPYFFAVAVAAAVYGFLALIFAVRFARRYFEERWAMLAAVGIWLASAFTAYLYFDLSWSHVESAFAVGLFVWYWDGTRGGMGARRWACLGLAAALMINVYYVNGVFLLLPAGELGARLISARRESADSGRGAARVVTDALVFGVVCAIGLLPTLITKRIIYGSFVRTGYPRVAQWHWGAPRLIDVLFSAGHGLLSWTPILILAVAGWAIGWRRIGGLGPYLVGVVVVFYYVIASYVYWDGVTSFSNRFFVSLTPVFVLGLAAALDGFARWFGDSRGAFLRACVVVALFSIWNVGFVYQWATEMVSQRSPVMWSEVVYNQFREVPLEAGRDLWGRVTGWARAGR